MEKKYKGISALLVATVFYSFFGVFTKLIGFKLPLFYQVGIRSLISAIILVLILIFFSKWKKVKKQDWKWFIVRSLIGIAAYIMSFVAFSYVSIGVVLFVFYAGSTIGGFIMGKIFFKEHLNKIKIISLILSIVGLYLIYSISVEADKLIYVCIALLSGFATAAWNTFSNKVSDKYSNLQINVVDYVISFAVILLISLFVGEQWVKPALNQTWGLSMLFAMTILPTGFLVVYGFKYLGAQLGSIIMLFEVVVGVILGFLLFNEVLSLTTLAGGAIILLAIILPNLRLPKWLK